MWLRDSLPKDCPELRVWTYGYDSKLDDKDNIGNHLEYAETFKRDLYNLRKWTGVRRSFP
jgi:hypothetical protein